MKLTFTTAFLFFTFLGMSQTFEVYVSDAGNFDKPPWQILKFDEEGKNPSVFINSHLNWPQDILFLNESNQVLISNLGSGCINRHNAVTGAYISAFACSISGPTRIKIGPDGLLYVLQWSGNGRVKRYDLDGTFVDDFTSSGVAQSIGLDWDSNRNLYVSSYNGDLVRKFDSIGNDLGIFINSNLQGPTNIWFDSNGDLLVSDYDGTAIKRFNANGLYLGNFINGLSNSEGVGFFPNGNILIGNGKTSSVRMYGSGGNFIRDFVTSGTANLLIPNAIAIREYSIVGIEELYPEKSNIISPNIGSTFYVNENFIERINKITIWNLSGKLLQTVELISKNSFILKDLSDGNYLATIELKNGEVKSEKIMVNRN